MSSPSSVSVSSHPEENPQEENPPSSNSPAPKPLKRNSQKLIRLSPLNNPPSPVAPTGGIKRTTSRRRSSLSSPAPLPSVVDSSPKLLHQTSVSDKLGVTLLTSKDKQASKLSLNTKDRGRWGQARSLTNRRKVDILQVASTSIQLSWDPHPPHPFKCVGYKVCMKQPGVTGYLPVVEDTLQPVCTFTNVDLVPDTLYKFLITSLSHSPLTSKHGGTRLAIPKSSVRSVAVRTLPQTYLAAWFFEAEKEATRQWRCFTGPPHLQSSPPSHSSNLTDFITVTHSSTHRYSGVHSLRLFFPGIEPTDTVEGGTAVDCGMEEDRLYDFKARVYHEWKPEE